MPRLFIVAAALAAAAVPAFGVVRTITFETDAAGSPIANMTPLGSQFSIWGITFAPNCFPPGGVSGSGSSKDLWAGNTDMTITSSDVGGVPTGSGNVLHAFGFATVPGWLAENGDASFEIDFANPVDSVKMDFLSVNGSAGFTGFIAYHDSTPLADVRALSAAATQTLSVSGVGPITRVAVREGTYDDWVGVDNIVVNTIEAPAPPSAMLIGAAGIAVARRPRRPISRTRS